MSERTDAQNLGADLHQGSEGNETTLRADRPAASPSSEDAVLAVLLEARRELTLNDLCGACPGVKRRVIRRCCERLTAEGVLHHKRLINTPGGTQFIEFDIWWHASTAGPWYGFVERHSNRPQPEQGTRGGVTDGQPE